MIAVTLSSSSCRFAPPTRQPCHRAAKRGCRHARMALPAQSRGIQRWAGRLSAGRGNAVTVEARQAWGETPFEEKGEMDMRAGRAILFLTRAEVGHRSSRVHRLRPRATAIRRAWLARDAARFRALAHVACRCRWALWKAGQQAEADAIDQVLDLLRQGAALPDRRRRRG